MDIVDAIEEIFQRLDRLEKAVFPEVEPVEIYSSYGPVVVVGEELAALKRRVERLAYLRTSFKPTDPGATCEYF